MRRSYVYCVGFIVSVALMYPLYWGKLWIIDDFGIVALHLIIEKNGGGPLQSVQAALSKTEVAQWGRVGRYRPIFYLTYTLKTYLFGTNAQVWFLWNFFIFFFSIICIGLSLYYFYPSPFVFCGILFFAALPCYVDIWGRLGPSEIEGCLWTAMFVYGLARYIKNYSLAWPTMCIAAFMAMGSKENFVLFLFPLSVVLAYNILKKCAAGRQFLFFLFPLSMACIVWGSIAIYTMQLPEFVDFYGRSLSLLARARIVFNFFYEGPRAVIIAAAFLLFYSCWCLARDKMENTGKTFAAMIVLSICILGNYVFYNGDTGLVLRYGYLEQLFLIMLFFVALFPLRRTLEDAWKENSLFRRHLLRWSCALGLLSVLSILALMRVNAFRAQRTQEFDAFLNRLQAYENVQIVNLGQPLSSYELYYSLSTFAEAGRAPKVYYFPVWSEPHDTFQKSLQDGLKKSAALDPSPPLTPNTALAEFSPNGWFRFIEHVSPHRDIEQTILMSGWEENIGYLGKFLGRTPRKGRRFVGDTASLALAIEKIQPYKIVIDAVPFDVTDLQSDVVFYVNNVEVKRDKLKNYDGGFNLDVPLETVERFSLHPNLLQLETRIENFDLSKPNGLTFHSIDVLPLL